MTINNYYYDSDGNSFNRYMVECEWRQRLKQQRNQLVLIDTWWNVNKLVYTVQCTRNLVLIDTWWNVNLILMYGIRRLSKF